jgi:hypothetical protein
LTEEAVERTAGVEDGEVVATVLAMSAADPVGYTVRGKRIPIPVKDAALGCPCQVDEPAVFDGPQTAESALVFSDLALPRAEFTLHTAVRTRGRWR